MKNIIIPLSILLSLTISSDCKKLQNGNYKVIFDDLFKDQYREYYFSINQDEFVLTEGDSIKHLKIEWLNDCQFKVVGHTEPMQPWTDFQKIHYSSGRPYYEITETSNDTSIFVLRKNLHVQMYSGKIIKLNRDTSHNRR
ncbi:hypothetical protein HUK80_17510 [Flavobacterium sp. MAH-1]|uniref:Uncharacterized protein n=1 Tax=Flavobacterium agri TaxID=2743471 RepID=A0A7Y8Y5E6_9FLAO|nr:hypothetical protein [Flavobacterium agri]NUY82704.1 hypothetical protein [Flavobacterium agri]NYA72727.1 hypothetical protein [Flavobacterium agri]